MDTAHRCNPRVRKLKAVREEPAYASSGSTLFNTETTFVEGVELLESVESVCVVDRTRARRCGRRPRSKSCLCSPLLSLFFGRYGEQVRSSPGHRHRGAMYMAHEHRYTQGGEPRPIAGLPRTLQPFGNNDLLNATRRKIALRIVAPLRTASRRLWCAHTKLLDALNAKGFRAQTGEQCDNPSGAGVRISFFISCMILCFFNN